MNLAMAIEERRTVHSVSGVTILIRVYGRVELRAKAAAAVCAPDRSEVTCERISVWCVHGNNRGRRSLKRTPIKREILSDLIPGAEATDLIKKHARYLVKPLRVRVNKVAGIAAHQMWPIWAH